MGRAVTQHEWHALPIEEVAKHLRTDLISGLTRDEAQVRLSQNGPNVLQEAAGISPWRILASQFADFMIVVLLAAALVAGLLGEPADAIAIVAIVIINAAIGFIQEYRADKALHLLKQMTAGEAKVVRTGQTITVPAAELVPGDIVVLEAGNAVPADLRLIEVAQLRIEEAALTGESVPVDKNRRAMEQTSEQSLSVRSNMAFRGTGVVTGHGRGIVVATGMDTELGRIAHLLSRGDSVQTPLQIRLVQFGKHLSLTILGICSIIFATGLARGEPPVQMFLLSISLAVAAIPEALPAVVTIALALGTRRMLTANALVRRLPAVETLGSVTYICSDKTGTLTENKMRLTAVYADSTLRDSWADLQHREPWKSLFMALALNNDVSVESSGEMSGDPTEIALVEAAAEAQYLHSALKRVFPRLREYPFDSERRRMTTVHEIDGRGIVFTKGAAESVVDCCISALSSQGEIPIDKEAIDAAIDTMSSQGLRVLAVAFRNLGAQAESKSDDVESWLVFLGLVGLIDPPRPGVDEAVRLCKEAGIVPVMITGDHALTARAIAARIGITDGEGRVITGAEFGRLSPREQFDCVSEVRVYARVDPVQKLNIVQALQQHGEFVAMTGDGVNDAPALKRANIGVAMGQGGTDVAREASDMVLLDDNFSIIIKAVREGRHAYDNIRKFVRFILTGNSAEVWIIFLAPLLGLPVPLLPIHILWINLVTDSLPGLALVTEPEDPGLMRRRPRPPSESLFARGLWQHVTWVGLLIAGMVLFLQAYTILEGSPRWQTVVFTAVTLSQMAHVLAVRSERDAFWHTGFFSNPILLGSTALVVAVQMAAVYWPPFQRIFHTDSLESGDLVLVAVLCIVVFAAVEVEKWIVRQGWIYKS